MGCRFKLRSTQANHPTCSKSKGAGTRAADPEVGHPIPRFPGMQIQAVREGEGKGKDARKVKRTRLKLVDKIRSLDLLGMHLKLFTEKIEVSGLEGLPERLDEARKRKNANIRRTA